MKIDNKTKAIITGASSGIGKALAVQLAQKGAHVALMARREEKLEETAQMVREAGGVAHVIPVDLTIEKDTINAMHEAIKRLDGLNVLVNNAGRGNMASVEDTPTEMLKSIFELDVFSLWYTTREALPVMKKHGKGHIINIASFLGKVAMPYNSVYVAAKHAVVGFSSTLRQELMGTGVNASVVCPQGVATPWGNVTEGGPISKLFEKGFQKSEEISREMGLDNPAKQMTTLSPEKVAQIIIETIENDGPADVYTHPGSGEISQAVQLHREEVEEQFKPMIMGIQQAYQEIKQETKYPVMA